jgi:hypothetical protein
MSLDVTGSPINTNVSKVEISPGRRRRAVDGVSWATEIRSSFAAAAMLLRLVVSEGTQTQPPINNVVKLSMMLASKAYEEN